MFLDGKAVSAVSEERQKAVLTYHFYQVRFRFDRESHTYHKTLATFTHYITIYL